MNTSKIFMGIGSLVLASAAFLAAKPSRTLGAVSSGYANAGKFSPDVIVLSNGHFTNTAPVTGPKHTAIFKTASGTTATLFTGASNSGNPVYYK
jgi:hypothetical protein